MKHRTFVPAVAALTLALAACTGQNEDDQGSDFEAEGDIATLLEGGEQGSPQEPEQLVPTEVPAVLVDAEGTVIGNVLFAESGGTVSRGGGGGSGSPPPDGTVVRVQVSGLTEGFHPMQLLDAAICGPDGTLLDGSGAAADPAATDVAGLGASVGGLPPGALPPLLVTETGVALISTLIGEVELDELLDEDGTSLVVYPAVGATDDGVEVDPGDAAVFETGSVVACAAIGGADAAEGGELGNG